MKFKSLLILSILLFILPSVSFAQVVDGYYRVLNTGLKMSGGKDDEFNDVKGDFYTYVTDGTIQVNKGNTTQQTFEALQLWEGLDKALSDPQSVVYIKNNGSYVDLEAQGTSVSKITSYNLTLSPTALPNNVRLSTVVSGMTVFLKTTKNLQFEHFKAETVASPSVSDYYTYWTLVPVQTTSGNFVGVKPRLTAGGKHYAPYYASYPFKLASAGMKAYYVKNVTDSKYELQEFASDAVIPGGTPVLIECSSANVADNKLELLYGSYTAVADNKLKGVYFYNPHVSSPTAATPFNASTMRVWAVQNDKLVLVNTPEGLPVLSTGVACLPANESYLSVAEGVAATLTDVADIPSHTITFDSDGGSAVDPITALEGSTITAPSNPTKTGYTFVGWNPAVPGTMPTSDMTVKAQWQINKYKVKFIADGETIKEDDLDYGSIITTPANNPSKTGYTFTGWDNSATVVPANDVTFTALWQINSYTVTFDTDGGSSVAAITKNYGEAITAPADPTKTGYTFIGWNKTIPSTMPAENVILKAQWKINSYSVTFDTDGGSSIAAITKNYGEAITAPANPTKTGYTFKGWDKAIPATMPAENISVKALWTINQYTVTFDIDGGSAVAAITKNYGEAITKPSDPTKTGYTFKGWDKAIPATMPAENVTVKAQWQINSHTVKFMSEGVTIKEETLNYGAAIVPPAENPTKIGAEFLGWSPSTTTIATMPDNDVVFEATFSTNDYTITFDTDGGTVIDPITAKYGTVVTKPADPTKTGYTFKGWDKEIPATIPAGDITIKALWTVNQYTITFNTDGGSAVATVTKNYGEAISKPSDPTKTGYTFKGWDKAIPATMPAEDVTVKAQWQINSYTVTFDTDGGSAVAAITKNYGEAITAPANPTKTGYTFKGWDKAIPGTMPAEDVTVKAQWQINSYTVSFDSDGGSPVDAITQDYNTAITKPADPTKTGYTFAGWEPAIPATIPAENLTLKAQWTINRYNVFFKDEDGVTDIYPSEQFDYNSIVRVPANPVRPNYDFMGWTSEIPKVMPAEDVILKAQWQLKNEPMTITLTKGWNWVAFSVNSTDLSNLNSTLASGTWTADDIVKNADKYASYSVKYNQWIGNFTMANVINPTAMYKVFSKEGTTLTIQGTVIDPEITDITINPYWNYIGYFNGGAPTISVAEALAGYDAKANDIIKSPTQSAVFDGTKWTGNLETLNRGEGYMLFRDATAKSTAFRFPVTAAPVGKAKVAMPVLYAGNMNVIAAVDGIDAAEGDDIVAVVNGEVRGTAAVNAEGKALLTIQGEASDAISFMLQRNGETLATAKAKIAFAEDAIIGSVGNPTAITFVPQDADNAVIGDVQAIYTAAGALLPTTDLTSLPKGTYIVSSLVDGKTVVTKVTK